MEFDNESNIEVNNFFFIPFYRLDSLIVGYFEFSIIIFETSSCLKGLMTKMSVEQFYKQLKTGFISWDRISKMKFEQMKIEYLKYAQTSSHEIIH